MCGHKRIIVVARSAPSLRLAKKVGRRTDSGCAVENAGASLSAQHFRHGRRRFPDIFAWRMLLAPPFAPKITTAIYKKYIKEYYLIFRLLFIIISVEISRGRTTLPKLFLSTLKKQSLCAVLSRSCSTSNEQKAPRMQSIRLWAAARSTARFLSSVPKSTFRSNCGRFVKGGMGRRLMRRVGTHQPPSGQYPHPDRQTLSVDLRSRCLRHGRKRSRTSGWVWENDTADSCGGFRT